MIKLKKIFKEEESSEILKTLGLFKNTYVKNMIEENITQEFRLKKHRWNKKLFPETSRAISIDE